MPVASRTVLFGALLLTLLAANWNAGAAPQGRNDAVAFDHESHVPEAWLDRDVPEVWRDCRGCHRFTAEAQVSRPQQHCAQCHAETLVVESRGESKDDLADFASRTREAFRHHTHTALACRECHHVDGRLYSSIPIRTGPGECARCHEPGQARTAAEQGFEWFAAALADRELARQVGVDPDFERPTDLAAYAQKLDREFAGPDSGINALLTAGGDFTHGDHLDLELSCESCHSQIKGAARNQVGIVNIQVKGCEQCHLRDAGEPARPARQPAAEMRRSWSVGTFAHADHYPAQRQQGVVRDGAHDEIEQQACARCHTYRPERPGFDGRDFPFDGDSSNHRYQDCMQCHDVPGWATGETVADAQHPPLHGSTAADGASRWGAVGCTDCHDFGGPDMAGTRPQAEVARWGDTTFAFAGQTHPFLTAAQADRTPGVREQDCSTCHRAVVPELPTRLVEKTFHHATHLPQLAEGQTYAAEACTTCHASAMSAGDAAALATNYRTYDLGVCANCHLGEPVREQVTAGSRPVPRTVVAFPHGPHAEAMSCAECHGFGAEDMTTKPAALACNECHNHASGDGGPETEYLFDEQVQSCAKCHRGSDPQLVSVPAIRGTEAAASDPRYGSQQQPFAGFQDAQFHPAGSRCADCHRADIVEVMRDGQKVQQVRPIVIEMLARDRTRSARTFVYGRRPGDTFHDEVKAKGEYTTAECYHCHWARRSIGDQWPAKPESEATRRELGNRFADFPGGPR